MSTVPLVVPVAATAAPVAAPAAQAKPLTAIQLIEQEVVTFIKQREQAIANVHAIDGAIQGAQAILARLKAEAAKAEAEAKKLFGEVKVDVEKVATEAKDEVVKVIDTLSTEAKKL